MTRASDAILAADLRAAGLIKLAVRAEGGEWNDYFGTHDMPQYELLDELRSLPPGACPPVALARLIDNIMNGKYDGTAAESEEWVRSPEGLATLNGLTPRERAMFAPPPADL